jgi:hypothetical protein
MRDRETLSQKRTGAIEEQSACVGVEIKLVFVP